MQPSYPLDYEAVVFDFDDTLVATMQVKWEHHREVARRWYGIDLTVEDFKANWGKPFNELIAVLYENSDTVENMRLANRSLNSHYPKKAHPGAVDVVVRLLDQGAEVAVVTSAEAGEVADDLSRLGFPAARIGYLQGADHTVRHKPDPAVFDPLKQHLRARGVSLSSTIYVGDALIDFCAARGAGLDFLGVATGMTSAEEFRVAGARSVASLAGVLPELSRPRATDRGRAIR
ncbi:MULTISPECIES: HAD hydrolase-like protein [unclassified Streptomyces]|uniref:HAD family hydrolase n=1 Tax=unclassified Streptomyces TaxID=2593676 RepID=UPI0011CDBA14|nr:HAD hydrolase-like protein [Streptomyces sp. me109]TXS73699.1 HAD family hydrolase [Streptomyces sp. me109]